MSFVRLYSEQYRVVPPEISPEALRHLAEYDWPGNVRELKNVVERVIVRGSGPAIQSEDLPSEIVQRGRLLVHRVEPASATVLVPASLSGVPTAAGIFERIVSGRESFWSAVYSPFMMRDLTRVTDAAIG